MESYKLQSEKTARYYDELQKAYDDTYGSIIQAYRPTDTDDLLRYIATSVDIHDGLKILDAGCGVCGPAIWIASHFDLQITGVTISEIQEKQATKAIQEKGLSKKISVVRGDYHELSQIVENSSFDRVLFLESLGHAGEPAKAISEAFKVLKPGGSIYIKDFYAKELQDENRSKKIDRIIENINRFYSYNTLKLGPTLAALRAVGFEIDFIRRFNFEDDISRRFEYEKRLGIDIFEGQPIFDPAEWLEIKCIKPLD